MANVLKNIYYRYYKFPQEFKHEEEGVLKIGDTYYHSFIRRFLKKGGNLQRNLDKVDKRIEANEKKIQELLGSSMAAQSEFPSLKLRMNISMSVLLVLLAAEVGLNIFTAQVIFDPYEKIGPTWDIIRLCVAFTITAAAAWPCEQLAKIFLTEHEKKVISIIIYSLMAIVAEGAIFYFGQIRANDIEGGGDRNIAIAMTTLAMIIPVIAGAVVAQISGNGWSEYRNRKMYNKRQTLRDLLYLRKTHLESLRDNLFKELSSAYWDTYMSVRTYKENYNRSKNWKKEEISKAYLIDIELYRKKAKEDYYEDTTNSNKKVVS